jgi:hypothetical protein
VIKLSIKFLVIIAFLTGHVTLHAQSLKSDSLIKLAINTAGQHSSDVNKLIFTVHSIEKARFSKFIGLGKKRLQNIEGIKEGQWYGNETISKVYLGNLSQMIHEINYFKPYRKKSGSPSLFFWPDFYQDFLGTQCISPLNYDGFYYYNYSFLSDTLVDNQVCKQFLIQPKFKTDRLFQGKLTLSLDGWIVRWEGEVLSDDILYVMDLKNSYFKDKWIPKQSNIIVKGGLLGIDGEFILNQNIIGPVENWNMPTQSFSLPTSKKERLNISEITFDEVFVSQLIRNLHLGLLRKWKLRPTADKIGIDSVVNNYLDVMPEKSDLVDDLRESTVETSIASFDALRKTPFNLSQLIFSKSFYFGERKKDFYPFEIYYKSPVFDSNFNTAEGFVVNSALVLRRRWAPYKFLELETLGRRSFGLNRNTGYLKLRYKTDSFDIQLANGDYISQFNPENTISPEMNSLATLLLKNNQMKIFRKEFWSLALINRFSSRFYLKALIESSRQSQMDNITGYYWVNYMNRTFNSNNPTNVEKPKEGFDTHNSFITQVQLGFRPFLSYSYNNNSRVFDWGSSPLILFKYRAGWPDVFKSNINFQLTELSYIQNISLSPWVKTGFILNAGIFIGDKPVYFQDFKHFNGGLNLVQTGDMLANHRLVGYYQNLTSGANQRLNVNHYSYSTAGNYVEALSQYQFTNLWLKPLLGFKKAYVKELLIANAYYINNQNLFYNEIGYGLDGVMKVLRLEAIANFNNGQFNYVGLRININSRIRIGNIPE